MQALTTSVRSVPEQISEISENYPHSIALKHGNRGLSYRDLDRRADQFAGYLTQLGVVPGSAVAICMERSFDWIIAALGVMRAGAAYVPLDSAWPDSRLRFAVKDSGATVLVARAAVLDRLAVETRGVDPSRDAAAIAAIPAVARRPVEPESLAYVIYTSGSTGVPKGVEITHANLAHLARWHRDAFGITHEDRTSHLAGLGFDAAAWELWPNLAVGATMCLANDEVRSSPQLLQQWMIQERVTVGFVPTVHATPMIAMEWPVSTALRFLLTGGDVLHRAPSVHLPFEVVNNYGPTECTVVATSAVVTPGSNARPPIGRAISGATVYLLNEQGEQVPDGSSGEIYVGGNGVGRGYRNLPDSTERSFLPDPFAGAPGARMYRTGDLGIRRSDGEIEFHGRVDRQTKIRGQRVELDEIASVLAHHPSIDFATAIAKADKGGENRIVAYVLPKENTPLPTIAELQKYLLSSLPDYMIPSMFVRLQQLPLSPNGKLDLKMLPQPTDENVLESTPARAPATPIEEKLLAIVRELLENKAVRPEDNLFLAGGHSLWGMQLLMRLRSVFGVDLTVQQLFEAPSVERLAVLVEAKVAEERVARGHVTLPSSVAAPAAQPRSTRNSIFWVHYLSANLAKAIGDDQPFFHIALVAEDFESLGDTPALKDIAACLVRRILAIQSEGPYVLGGFCLGGILAYEIASQLQAAGHDVPLLLVLDTPPNPSFYKTPRWNETVSKRPLHRIKRAVRFGLRKSFMRFSKRVVERFKPVITPKPARTKMQVVQDMVVAAASRYKPEKYDGKVVLLLASGHVTHANFLAGWQAVVPNNLHTHYVEGLHDDLLGQNVQIVADAIGSHLASTPGKKSLASVVRTPSTPISSSMNIQCTG